jgi:hypothetical protein
VPRGTINVPAASRSAWTQAVHPEYRAIRGMVVTPGSMMLSKSSILVSNYQYDELLTALITAFWWVIEMGEDTLSKKNNMSRFSVF